VVCARCVTDFLSSSRTAKHRRARSASAEIRQKRTRIGCAAARQKERSFVILTRRFVSLYG